MGGKNPGKPSKQPRKSGGGGGGDGDGPEFAEEKPFHSKEFEQQYLDDLMNPKDRLTWDEFKEQQKQKGLLEGAAAAADEEAQRKFRAELDEARAARLSKPKDQDKGGKRKHKSKKHKKDKKDGKDKKDKKKRRRKESSSSSDSDSDSSDHKKKKKKKGKADGPVSLRAFFNADSDSD